MNRSNAWICLVCGYVHRGPEPPEECPVCGAAASDFEAYAEPVAPAPRAVPREWRCLICGYVHTGPAAPEACSVCGADSSEFEPVAPSAVLEQAPGKALDVVILGGGIAGVSAAEAVRSANAEANIVLLSEEAELPYYRLNLTRYLAGEIGREALAIHPPEWYETNRIQVRRGIEAMALQPEPHQVMLADGACLRYDRLILACGAHPFIPPIPGASLPGGFGFRNIEDAEALIAAARPGTRCVVIGGGILGLETASGLLRRGARVTVLEGFDWLLPRQLDREAASVLAGHVERTGIELRYAANISGIRGTDHVEGVMLADGTEIPADMVVITTGVRTNTALARKAGLSVNQGILVDSCLRTSHPDIFAAGDVAEHQGVLYGLWEPARYQGAIAGQNASGAAVEFGGLPRANTLKVLDVSLFSAGAISAPDASYAVTAGKINNDYYRFLFHDNRLAGAILVGDTRLAATVMKAIKSGMEFSRLLQARPGVLETLAFLTEMAQ